MADTTSTQTVEVDVRDDATYVFINDELAGSVHAAYAPGDRGAYRYGWRVWDERDDATTKNYGVMSTRRLTAEQKLATVLGLPGTYLRRDYPA